MIAIVDYGAGNIFSVKNALDYLNLECTLTSNKDEIISSDAVILPGVGAFPEAMRMLEKSGLVDTIKEQAEIKPFLGICLGMQLMFEKGYEFEECDGLGGTMRLGAYECVIKPKSLLSEIYEGKKSINERHRHRFEANPRYKKDYEKNGLIISGESSGLIEVVELAKHPFFIGVQFHPEFTSHLVRANPVILAFIKEASEYERAE